MLTSFATRWRVSPSGSFHRVTNRVSQRAPWCVEVAIMRFAVYKMTTSDSVRYHESYTHNGRRIQGWDRYTADVRQYTLTHFPEI